MNGEKPLICMYLGGMTSAAKHPQCCRQTDDDEQGGLTFDIEKGRLSFRLTAPYNEERRRAASEAAKKNSVNGMGRSVHKNLL